MYKFLVSIRSLTISSFILLYFLHNVTYAGASDMQHDQQNSATQQDVTTQAKKIDNDSIVIQTKKNIKKYIKNHKYFNAAYAFDVQSDQVIKDKYGVLSFKTKKPLLENQRMPVASATKTITAIAIMKLHERGLLDLHTPISTYLTEKSAVWPENKIPEWAKHITIHRLLTHTTSLPEYFMRVKPKASPTSRSFAIEILHFVTEHYELNHSLPGTQEYHYCNTNYSILGLIIESVAQKELAQFYHDEIFAPLGLKTTKVFTPKMGLQQQKNQEAFAQSSDPVPVRYFLVPTEGIIAWFKKTPIISEASPEYAMIPMADGGVISNPTELMTIHKSLHSGKLLSKKSLNLMKKRYYELPPKQQGQWRNIANTKTYTGYGLRITDMPNGNVVYHHPGHAVAIRSESGCINDESRCFAVLGNTMVYLSSNQKKSLDFSKPKNQLDVWFFVKNIILRPYI